MSDFDSGWLDDVFWTRHSNPKSGWSRVPAGPLLVYAIYRRDWRLFLATAVWVAINPFLFSPPESEDAWMTRAVLAERWWIQEEGNGTFGLTYPNICTTVGTLASIYTLYAAWRRHPIGASLGTILALSLKFWWIGVLVRRFDERAT